MSRNNSRMSASWNPKAKILASVAIIIQLLAVVAEPLRFFSYGTTRGSSPAADPVRNALGPYVEFAFLNHGYFFFAPEPGPSHLMRCDLRFSDGSTTQVHYPEKTAQRPRLLYHRHFMLAEFLNQIHTPPVDPNLMKDASKQEADAWTSNRMRYEMVRDSMQRHLVARFGADSADIVRLRHILPGSEAVLEEGLPLNDPSLFIALPDALEPPSEVGDSIPQAPASSLPASQREESGGPLP